MDLDQQKETAGRVATFSWIGACIVWIFVIDEAVFISWQTPVLVFVGMFVAALVFGTLRYGIVRALTKLVIRRAERKNIDFDEAYAPGSVFRNRVSLLGIIVGGIQTIILWAVAYYVVKWTFSG